MVVAVATTIAAIWIAYELRNVLTPFLLAFLVAYALDPFVDCSSACVFRGRSARCSSSAR